MDAGRYLGAVEQQTALRPIVDELARHDVQLSDLQARRRALLQRLQDQRREAFMLRRSAADEVNTQLDGTLEMTIGYLGDTAGFADRLGAVQRGSKVSSDSVAAVATHPGMDGVELSLLVGGLVLFGRRPQLELESSRVVVGALSGTDIGDNFVDRKDLTGGLFEVVDQIEAFLRLHLRTGHEIVDFEPERREEVPVAALREAVVNALAHRDYTIPGADPDLRAVRSRRGALARPSAP